MSFARSRLAHRQRWTGYDRGHRIQKKTASLPSYVSGICTMLPFIGRVRKDVI